MSDYIRLKDLVGSEFKVEEVYNYQWKKWDTEAKQMLVSDSYEQGYRKVYTINSDKGKFDISASQIGNMLEGVSKKGEANIVGRTFTVKSNGKDGMEIRYYINPVKEERGESPAWEARRQQFEERKVEQAGLDVAETDIPDKVDLSEIPF